MNDAEHTQPYVERLTLLLLLLYGGSEWYTRLPLSAAAIAALVVPALAGTPGFWLLCSVVALSGCARDWATADNHKYLISYWCVAYYFYRRSGDLEGLARSARLLIGCCFLFAMLWKLRSADYRMAEFFHYTLLTDARFSLLAHIGGGIDPGTLERNRAALHALTFPASSLAQVSLHGTEGTRRIAVGLTWITLAIESALAAAFLAPASSRLRRVRDPLLILFAAGTYLLAPVIGFGWVLLTMGLAQSNAEPRAIRWGYAAAFLLLVLYRSPWAHLLVQFLST